MGPIAPIHTDIVLVGGGHAHVAVLKQFGMKPEPGVRLSLVSPTSLTPYSGMLPGYLAGHYTLEECHLDLRKLCRFAGARYIQGTATGIDDDLITVAGRPGVPFDLASFDIGSTPDRAGIDGVERAIPVKPVDRFLSRWNHVEKALEARDSPFRLVVIGAGAGGVEAALGLAYRARGVLRRAGRPADLLEVAIVSKSAEPLADHSAGTRRRMRKALEREGVTFHGGHIVRQVAEDSVECEPALSLPCDAAILVTPAAAAPWLADTGLALDERGFLRVGATLQSVSDPRIFAAGDAASFDARALPKSGVYAVRQGPVLARSLRRVATGGQAEAFRPQPRTLALVSMGRKRAVLSYGPLSLEGDWAWRYKDWIDRRWMRRYQELPEMASPPAAAPDGPPPDMRCGGCGAKVPADVLRQALAGVPAAATETVLIGLDAPDDAAVVSPPPGKVLVQTVDQFRDFVGDPFLFGRIAANHCLGDLHAMGAEPAQALATVVLPPDDPPKVAADLSLLLQGALATFAEEGVTLIGGHTGEGQELSLGFTVNGFADPASLLRKGGMRVGDVLLMTKPLGTGVLMAADMRHAADGRDIDAAIACMLHSNREAAAIVRANGATAATDITGFGLLGHVAEMAAAADVSIALETANVPVLHGAVALLEAGIESSLQAGNRRSASGALAPGAPNSAASILFDPQTAGGLLAAVPADRAAACIAALHAAGYGKAARIGTAGERRAESPLIVLS